MKTYWFLCVVDEGRRSVQCTKWACHPDVLVEFKLASIPFFLETLNKSRHAIIVPFVLGDDESVVLGTEVLGSFALNEFEKVGRDHEKLLWSLKKLF